MNLAAPAPPPKSAARSRPEPMRQAPIERARLDGDIAALAAAHAGDPAAFRKAAIERFLRALEEGRERVQAAFEADNRGLACASRLAHLEDELVRAIHHCVVTF